MDFTLTRQQEMIRDMVREFAEKEVSPQVSTLDEKGEFPFALVKRLAELGLVGMFVPKQYGGSDIGHIAKMIVIEEISRVYPPLAYFYGGQDGGTFLLQTNGTEEQKLKYLPPLCKAEKLSCFGVTEPTGGSDLGAMQVTAESIEDGYLINGRKVFITMGGVADVCFVVAKTGERFSAFVVEKGTPGFEAGRRENICGLRCIPINELIFTNCRVPKENLIGQEGRGLAAAMAGFTLIARPSMAGIGLGIARGCYEAALRFAKERKLYGAPIAELQAIQFMLADMEVEIEAAKWLCYYTAWLIEQGKSSREVGKDTARAKLHASEVASRVSLKAIQIMGGYGVTTEYQVVRRLNDALILFPSVGANQVMRVIIGREITQ